MSSIIRLLLVAMLVASASVFVSGQGKETKANQMASSASSVETELKGMEDKWEAAIKTHDSSAVEPMVADDFVGTTSRDGKTQTKAEMLAELKNDTDVYNSTATDSMQVHHFGNNVAVVTGGSKETGKDKDGKDFDRTYRWTDTWVNRNGKWQVVASQVTLIPPK
jgi:ketosteroid isomerase-like protein